MASMSASVNVPTTVLIFLGAKAARTSPVTFLTNIGRLDTYATV
jgi:hypothetical protein